MFYLRQNGIGELVVALSFAVVTLAGCDSRPVEADRDPIQGDQVVEARGTIRYVDHAEEWAVELGFAETLLALTGNLNREGEDLPPDNLPDHFREEGLRVIVSGTIHHSASNVDPWAEPLVVSSIEKSD